MLEVVETFGPRSEYDSQFCSLIDHEKSKSSGLALGLEDDKLSYTDELYEVFSGRRSKALATGFWVSPSDWISQLGVLRSSRSMVPQVLSSQS